MIRHYISSNDLKKRIIATKDSWFDDAANAFAKLPIAPTSKDFKSLWSDIKSVYIDLQGSKCMYCEMPIEGAIANDVEHFRPKAKVTAWKVPKPLQHVGISLASSSSKADDSAGYRNLAYCPENYGASCKHCNSVLKKNHFPINGDRDLCGDSPRKLTAEKPYFLYPISDIDADPQELIGFEGMHPKPLASPGSHNYRRAIVVITVFQLNDALNRKELFRSRCHSIGELHARLNDRKEARTKADWQKADEWIQVIIDSKQPHTNCLQCFAKLFENDPEAANQAADDALFFLQNGRLRI